MRCYVHPGNRANWRCDSCGREICNDCLVFEGERPRCRPCAGIPYPPPVLQSLVPPFPPPWDRRIAQNFGRLALASGVLACCLFLALGNIVFRMVSDPENGLSYMGQSSESDLYMSFFLVYFAISGISGVVLAVLAHRARTPYKVLSLLMIGLPGLLAIPVYQIRLAALIPVFRDLVALSPPLGLVWFIHDIGVSPYAALEPARRNRLGRDALAIVILSVLMAAFFEQSWSRHKFIGSIVMYAGALALGLLSLALSGRVLSGAGSGLGAPPAAGPPPPVAAGAHSPVGGRRRIAPWRAVLALAIVLPVVFLPPLDRLAAEPRLEIHDLNGHLSRPNWTLAVTIINRGGQATDGPVQVLVSNGTGYNLSASVDGLEGFGSRRVVLNGSVPDNSSKRILLHVKLVYKGKDVDSSQIYLPPPVCLIMPSLLPLALAGVALSGARRKRPRGR